ncbi:MAG: hypothetical protein AAF216_02015 [Pseudomonadota bacterium]
METDTVMNWLQSNSDVMIAVVSAMVALVSAVIARVETRRQRKLQELELRHKIDGASLVWGSEAIDAMSAASALALSRQSSVADLQTDKLKLASQLSALADRGRLFFPNLDPHGDSTNKESAYRGARPPILDMLIFACHETRRIGEDGVSGEDSAGFITECRRQFVSELQAHLDPSHLDEVIERYTDQSERVRSESLDRAGELAIVFDTRRPGILKDTGAGWSQRINAETRKALLHAQHNFSKDPSE